MDASPAFKRAEGEILLRVRDLALVDDPPVLLRRAHRSGTESEARLRFLEDDVFIDWDEDGRLVGELSASGLDRVREFASELGHEVNRVAPQGVRWTVAIHFRRLEQTEDEPAVLLVLWAIVPDPHWCGPEA